ncbi:MAG: hypothetical protein F6K08_28130 [Okeania sp. SIO1H6]|nr:hypothetical protein [Okeania sp. SIO1H6]
MGKQARLKAQRRKEKAGVINNHQTTNNPADISLSTSYESEYQRFLKATKAQIKLLGNYYESHSQEILELTQGITDTDINEEIKYLETVKSKYQKNSDDDCSYFHLQVASKPILEEISRLILFKELHYITRLKKPESDFFELARFVIFSCVATEYFNRKIDSYSELSGESFLLFRESGVLIHSLMGMGGLHDQQLWNYIPTKCHRHIDFIWDGIGEWRC